MFKKLHKFANPNKFLSIAKPITIVCKYFFISFLLIGLSMSLIFSPPDYQQNETVRIMYIHVPSAWISLLAYFNLFMFSIFFIIWRFPLFMILAKESSSIGIIFTLSTIITGALWGKPTWGTFWVWDARLTSFLILFFIYLGLIFINSTFKNTAKSDIAYAFLAIIGGFNLPIIKFSVDWWNTLHQPASVLRIGGPSISFEMLIPLIIMAISFLFLYIYLLLVNTKSGLLERKINTAIYLNRENQNG
mgnify:FL=1